MACRTIFSNLKKSFSSLVSHVDVEEFQLTLLYNMASVHWGLSTFIYLKVMLEHFNQVWTNWAWSAWNLYPAAKLHLTHTDCRVLQCTGEVTINRDYKVPTAPPPCLADDEVFISHQLCPNMSSYLSKGLCSMFCLERRGFQFSLFLI